MIYNSKVSKKYVPGKTVALKEVVDELRNQGYRIEEKEESTTEVTGIKISGDEIIVEKNGEAEVIVTIEKGTSVRKRYYTYINSKYYEINLENKEITVLKVEKEKEIDEKIYVNVGNKEIATATINENKIKVKGKKAGTTTLTATMDKFNISKKIITKELTQDVATISDSELEIDGAGGLQITLADDTRDTMDGLVWTSSNPEIATVSKDGTVICGTKTTNETGKTAKIVCKGKDTRVECTVSSTAKIVFTNLKEENVTINGEEASNTNPIIPAGYSAIDTKNAKWKLRGAQTDIDKGLVIMDQNGNCFVWVPVAENVSNSVNSNEPMLLTKYDIEKKYYKDILGFENSSKFEEKMNTNYDKMIEKINKYKGFYIARYETSYKEKEDKAQSIANVKSASVIDENIKTWYKFYKIQNKFIDNDNIKSDMISGMQYDLMMNWISKTGTDVNSESNREAVRNRTQKTGNNEYTDILNNIHDLYGCNYEWTLESSEGEYRVERGGNFDLSKPPSIKNKRSPVDNRGQTGSRMVLVIE